MPARSCLPRILQAGLRWHRQCVSVFVFAKSIVQPASGLRRYSMMDRSNAPYMTQDPKEVGRVLDGMHAHLKKGGKGGFHCKMKTYDLGDGSKRTIDSWQMNDWDYKKPNVPTYARGFFTHQNNGKPEIALRGYDKFFNIDELNKTKWRNLEQNTRGPYELSVKENGCIIFIAGLDDETLVVTSKHSLGPRDSNSANHAFAGEKWIDRQLSALGRSRKDLAARLRSMNATAVAELCDDEFEEHVLQYRPDVAGLYLHGINLNLPSFATFPGNLVAEFADEWGFRKVMYTMENHIGKVKTFLDEVAETGHYAGRDTEGFVIRCQARDSPQSPWHDWFFKYKFEEPYLMYRQWRECTKAIISKKLPKYRKHRKITEEYLDYARRQLQQNPELGKLYNENHGIIDMRNGFLAEKGLKGSEIIRREMRDNEETGTAPVTHNVVLVPIATIGCGKTTIAVALSKLFGWGHEQNDNIQGKGQRAQRFAMACTNAMSSHPVIISDRNNHQRREREQIMKDIRNIVFDTKFVALHWVHDPSNLDAIREAMRDRVLARGDNHQTIQAGSKSPAEIIGIMNGFLERFQPLDASHPPDGDFDLVIDLDVTADSIGNLSTIVKALHKEYPKLFMMPSDEAMESAITSALDSYKPDIKHDLGPLSKQQKTQRNKPAQQKQAQSKPARVEYFGIFLNALNATRIIDAAFANAPLLDGTFYKYLKSIGALQSEFHVTLIHRASMADNGDYWSTLNESFHSKADATPKAVTNGAGENERIGTMPDIILGQTKVWLRHVVWDERVMAVVVDLPEQENDGFKTVNKVGHITLGTRENAIRPKESNDLLARWARGDRSGDGWHEIKIPGKIVLDGDVKAVMSR